MPKYPGRLTIGPRRILDLLALAVWRFNRRVRSCWAMLAFWSLNARVRRSVLSGCAGLLLSRVLNSSLRCKIHAGFRGCEGAGQEKGSDGLNSALAAAAQSEAESEDQSRLAGLRQRWLRKGHQFWGSCGT